jgi:uncharacterized lipoprotein YehR (DUF1307 family)
MWGIRMKNILIQLVMALSLVACSSPDNAKLLDMVGENVQSPPVKSFLIMFKHEHNSSRFSDVRHYKQKGIELHFKNDKVLNLTILKQVFLYSGREGDGEMYMGELPLGLSFDQTLARVHEQLGEGYTTHSGLSSGHGSFLNYDESYENGRVKVTYDSKIKSDDMKIDSVSIHAEKSSPTPVDKN